jgi:heme o synthase
MSVKTIAGRFNQTPEDASVSLARASDFFTLMKPRVMVLAVFTAVLGLIIAPGKLNPFHACLAVLAIAAGAGAAGVALSLRGVGAVHSAVLAHAV